MPVWMVELFGSTKLNQAFVLMNLIVSPFWIAMILFPANEIVRRFSQPMLIPPVLSLIYVYAVYLLVTITEIPPLTGIELSAMRSFVDHPLVFLVVWSHYLVIDLFLGMAVFQDASRKRVRIPVELVLCWFFGPLGLFAYAVRLLSRRLLLR